MTGTSPKLARSYRWEVPEAWLEWSGIFVSRKNTSRPRKPAPASQDPNRENNSLPACSSQREVTPSLLSTMDRRTSMRTTGPADPVTRDRVYQASKIKPIDELAADAR